MKLIYVTICVILTLSVRVFSQDCKPRNCILPVKKGCENYCKERVLKYSDTSELKRFGFSKDSIGKIYEFRKSNKDYNFKKIEKKSDGIDKDSIKVKGNKKSNSKKIKTQKEK
ncbi:MAG: hypothetical protein HXX16_12450 [Bacteroidales bacterium]|nr:hypothetical protein [Bacteroidales bacterium]